MPTSASGAPVAAFYTLVPAPWGPIHDAATDRALDPLPSRQRRGRFAGRVRRRVGGRQTAAARDQGDAPRARRDLASTGGTLRRLIAALPWPRDDTPGVSPPARERSARAPPGRRVRLIDRRLALSR